MAESQREELRMAATLKKKISNVQALDQSGKVFKGMAVWTDLGPTVAADPECMFVKCIVMPGSTAERLICSQIEPKGHEHETFEVPQDHAWNTNSNIDPLTYGDIGMLPHTSVPNVLDFLKQRFMNNQIYTTAHPLLVAINPFKDLGNCTNQWIAKYRDTQDVTSLPPHVFCTSRVALDNLHDVKKSQTIVVSGESGAGKTEATKQMMRYFAAAKSGLMDLRIQNAIMAANPVLEAFGNAKTVRNNNSSRFGRYMQLDVAREGGIKHGEVVAFLLEKSRVLVQDQEERSYHIFYQFLKSPDDFRKKYNLKGVNDYAYINPSCTDVPGIDDHSDFKECCESLVAMQMSEVERDAIWSIVAGVLKLGNIKVDKVAVDGVDDAAEYSEANKALLKEACDNMFLDFQAIYQELTVKKSLAGKQEVTSRWSSNDSDMLKSSLAKAMYEKLFMWIIKKLNTTIQPAEWGPFIAMLDIFGFEVFKNNSFEQLCINATNELLQKTFVDIVFEKETALYRSEGISNAELVFTSNKAVIDLLMDRKNSIFTILEDQCLGPSGSDEKFISAMKVKFKDNDKFVPAKAGGNINFLIDHTIGPIQYCGTGFMYKNKDVLRAEIMEVVQASSNPVAAALFEGIVMEKGKMAKGQLIGSQFQNQVLDLIGRIDATEPHFVRCVKPNETKKPLDWRSSKILIQMHSLSILEALQLRQLGFAYRRPFKEFLTQFRYVDVEAASSTTLNPEEAARKLIETANLPQNEYGIGKTMVFLKQSASKLLTKFQREKLATWTPLVSVIEAACRRIHLKSQMAKKVENVQRLQAHIRRHIVDKQCTPAPGSTPPSIFIA